MATLPVISGRDAVKTFEKLGFVFHRQKGSHIILYHPTVVICRCQITESLTEERSAPSSAAQVLPWKTLWL
jgi:predicted RNA binding protein YcfA (HicA-like mRNA interferase family)